MVQNDDNSPNSFQLIGTLCIGSLCHK